MFFFKKPKLFVDAFTKVPGIEQFYPIAPARKFFPDWWKQLPKSHIWKDSNGIDIEQSTLKRCDGFVELYKNGIVIPLWSDIALRTGAEGQWAYHSSQKDTILESHPKEQYGDEFNNYSHIKIVSPWFLSEKTGCNFYYAPATWNLTAHYSDFILPPGIINFKYQGSVHVNTFFHKVDKQILLEAGTPLVQLIPLSDKEVVVKCHTLSQDEYSKKVESKTYAAKFMSKYKAKKKIIDSNSKCPFGFGK
jgi:hypothetical protein